ncbi:hypothetical protein CL632_02485 [bacterium]|jgi:undecaprenyl-diphosphatase|nr:hypothetical protein [bacterium]MDP6571223.1 phosphatase PAP2 family protein [Patescibacteria group bacterium]|tara:strand:+ start:10735 stop:11247 length:513 start_codon:yes stop_codon:yes gene_type:complete
MEILDLQISSYLFDYGQTLPKALVVFLASYLIWVMIVLIVLLVKRHPRITMRILFYALASSAAAYAVNAVIGFFFFRERPFVSLEIEALINTSHLDKSFPSDHAAVSWALAVSMALHYKKSAILFILIALLIIIGRVLAGVHFASDVVAGAFVGSMAAWIVYLVASRKKK